MATKDSLDNRLRNNGILTPAARLFPRDNDSTSLQLQWENDDYNNRSEFTPFTGIATVQEDDDEPENNDSWNYVLLIALYTLQGLPMGLSASIPFLIQQKISLISLADPSADANSVAASRQSYNANAIFALCSWPFSLKLLWAPLVDACFIRRFGRRKSWLVPVQCLAGLLMIFGASFVEHELGLGVKHNIGDTINVKGITAFFFVLYFLMATQDVAVDGWALTMLSKTNRGRGPVCNSIGQNIGYFLSFVGFLALNDAESSEVLWRPLLGIKSSPNVGLVSLGSFLQLMGYFMLFTTIVVAIVKREADIEPSKNHAAEIEKKSLRVESNDESFTNIDFIPEATELDAAEIGLRETYHRLWCVCQLPSVRWLFLILLSYRLPTALGDNVKFLKAVEYGLSTSTTALLSPTVVLPLGILVPIIATKIWYDYPLQQFMHAYKVRITMVPLVDSLMLLAMRRGQSTTTSGRAVFWGLLILSTALQSIVNSLQFNAQMTFFAKRVDPAIGGSYMTLLNTAANLGGAWPASFIMWLIGWLSTDPLCFTDAATGIKSCQQRSEPYFGVQMALSLLGFLWIALLGQKVQELSDLPVDAWRTQLFKISNESDNEDSIALDVELGGVVKSTQRLKKV